MKPKLFIGIALVVVLTAGLLILNRQHTPAPVKSATKIVQSPVAPPAGAPVYKASVPISTGAKMIIVTPKVQPSGPDLLTANWSTIQLIVDVQAGLEQRLNAIGSLSPHLTEEDWNALRSFLLKPDSSDQSQLGQILKNNLMDALCALNPPPAGLDDVLISIYRGRNQNAVLRDYAVQHMAAYYEQIALQKNSSQEEQKIQDALWEATHETGDSISGTSLLALERLSQEYSADFDQGKIASAALQMARDFGVSELTHITGFQVCAHLGVSDALPVVLQAAQNGETVPVQISAIAALGSLGDNEQIPFLNSVLSGAEDRLKPAAHHALEQIMVRNNLAAIRK